MTIEDQKHNVGPGWHFLLESLDEYVRMRQSRRVSLVTEDKRVDVPGGLFKFNVDQIKEKLGSLRIYATVTTADDIYNFDQWDYENELHDARTAINAYIAALESLSGSICEMSGERGTMRNIGGWMKTLCEKCYTQMSQARTGKPKSEKIKKEVTEII